MQLHLLRISMFSVIIKQMQNKSKIKALKDYFQKREDVLMAFLFGSQAKKLSSKRSDWDISVYLKPASYQVEWEQERDYPQEDEIWGDLIKMLDTDNVDLIILNRAPADISATAIAGLPLIIKDRRAYLEFMLIITKEAEDYRQTVQEYSDIYWRSASLSEEDGRLLNKRILFLSTELKEIEQFRNMNQFEYQRDSIKRKAVERWIENLMNASIDIAKTILASEHKSMPSNYREILLTLAVLPGFLEDTASQLAEWAKLRNILAHEYLDVRWQKIQAFVAKADSCFHDLIKSVQEFLK